MIVADVSFIDIFWWMLWFFFLFIWIVILVHIVIDLFRDHTLSGGMKTLWVLFVVVLAFLAVFIYLIVRGKGMAERATARQQQFDSYVRSSPPPVTPPPPRPTRSPGPSSCWTPARGQGPRLSTST